MTTKNITFRAPLDIAERLEAITQTPTGPTATKVILMGLRYALKKVEGK
jgi:hypothetical protein